MTDTLGAEATTYTIYNKEKRRTSILSEEFEPALLTDIHFRVYSHWDQLQSNIENRIFDEKNVYQFAIKWSYCFGVGGRS